MGRKRRAMKAKLDQFLEYIHSSEEKMSQEQYLQLVREKVKQFSKKDLKQIQTNYILEKICEVCNDYHHDEQLLLCDYCDDAYHTFCLSPPLKEIPDEEEDWFCPVCVEQKYQMEKEKRISGGRRSNSKVQKLLEQFNFKNQRDVAQKIQICGKCNDMILYMENEGVIEESEKCIKCNKMYHKECFSKKKESILCTSCQTLIKKQIPTDQKLIEDYFIRGQQESLGNKSYEQDDKKQKEKSDKKNKSTQGSKKMINQNKNEKQDDESDDEILDVDALKEMENMRQTRGRRAKLLQEKEQKQNQQTENSTEVETQARVTRQRTQEKIEKLNDQYINDSNKTVKTVLAKKRKKNDFTEFISNKTQINDDSLTQPLTINQKTSSSSYYNDECESNMSTTYSSTSNETQPKNSSAPINSKGGVKFLLPVPSSNPIVNLECKQSLIYALKAKNILFYDDLCYTQQCPKQSNTANLEPNLQIIDLANSIIFQKFKEMSRQGIYAPVIVEEDKIQGFIVRAMDDIKAKTLICEYVGEVDYARNHIFNKNDSIMDLLRTARSKTSLVIVPDKKGNLARFLSGINNTSKKSMAKQNVHSVRFNINGESRVILYAKKNIKKGELLYYDYNAGGFGEYPTQNFV
ncbi:hypothetical protein ABPG72_016356 [Tetrahymena utriculariae]